MRGWSNCLRRMLLIAVSLLLAFPAAAGAKPVQQKRGREAARLLHHMHTMMDHGLIMVLEGSSLVMLSTGPGDADDPGRAHGLQMIADGKAMIRDMLSGAGMKEMHRQGRWSDPLMADTHRMGAAILALVDDLEQMNRGAAGAPEEVRRVQIRLSHALEMAAQGANLVMLGKMKLAGGIDEQGVLHGRSMIAAARSLWNGLLGGRVLQGLSCGAAASLEPGRDAPTCGMVRHGRELLELLEKMDTGA